MKGDLSGIEDERSDPVVLGRAPAVALQIEDWFGGLGHALAGSPPQDGGGDLRPAALHGAAAYEAARHSPDLESAGQLTGHIARDFDHLLTVISGNLRVLATSPTIAGDADARQVVGATARAARRGAELVGQLLAFSRRLALHPVRVPTGALLHTLAGLLTRTLDQRIRITVDVTPDCPPCLADAVQLESALINLAVNARDAMLDGGTLSLRAWPVDILPLETGVSQPSESYAGCVAIAVGDTGAGMTDAVKRRAVEPFFTTKEAGCGTGLGLSAVAGFIEQSHGAMRLDSTIGVGTTITLFLPRHLVAARAEDDS